jgi:flagellar hook-basal body complex protein FliE
MLDPISATTSPPTSSSIADSQPAVLRGGSPAASSDTSSDFGSFLAQLVANTASTLKAGEATAVAGVTGQASTQQVVDAVMTTEQTLQTAIAIRDKVVSAILELSRMSI